MNIYYDDIKLVLSALTDSIDGYGNADLSIAEKVSLSEQLATASQLIRLKYQLTSGYYVQAEFKALEKIKDIKNAKTMHQRMNISLLSDFGEDYTSRWVVDWSGNLRCAVCNSRSGSVQGISNYIPCPSNFCPTCGRRMTNGNIHREKEDYDA